MINDLDLLVEHLRKNNLTIAFAESITSGAVNKAFANHIDIGNILLGSLVTYKPITKQKVLGVNKEMLEKFTAESQQVTNAMVLGLSKLLKPDVAVAVTGLANPGGSETAEKPVGSVFIAILYKDKIWEYRNRFYGSREQVIEQAVQMIFTCTLDAVTSK
jgi:nicotinamide-nucleotide amidase